MEDTNRNTADVEEMLAGKTEDEMLDMFVAQMLVDKGFVGLSEELREEFHRDIRERLVLRINEAIVAALPDDKLMALEEMLEGEGATPEGVNELVESAGVDMTEPIRDAMMDFRRAYLAGGEERG